MTIFPVPTHCPQCATERGVAIPKECQHEHGGSMSVAQPWTSDGDYVIDGRRRRLFRVAFNGVSGGVYWHLDQEEREAVAQLASAAPELLAALKILRALLAAKFEHEPMKYLYEIRATEDAIAKAEGRS